MIERLKAALAERYDIERKLGEGGMATVYLASDPKHGRKVAVKVLRPELAAVVGAERFLTEIETTAGLQHPHILPLFDSGQADGFLFYVMPYVEGESLRERLDREKQLPVDEAVRIAQETAQALDYAHRHGVVHRDVKPANILLHEGRPLVVDFGIALAVQQAGAGRLTETGMSLGTPYYMSPEQATGDRDVDARSDVYSLACVLYEMLTGEPPYTGSTAQVVLGRIITGDVPRPSLLRRSVPPHVEDAILHALKKVPADRPGSAAAFAAELAGEGVPAARPRGRSPRASGVGTRVEAVPPLARLALGALGAALVALVAWQAGRRAGAGDADPVVRAVLELPSNAFLETAKIALSPDGRTVVVAARRDGARVLLRRPLAALRFEPIAGTVEAENPSISPDGRWLAFNGPAGLVRVPVEGGGTVSIDSEMEWGGRPGPPTGRWSTPGTTTRACGALPRRAARPNRSRRPIRRLASSATGGRRCFPTESTCSSP